MFQNKNQFVLGITTILVVVFGEVNGEIALPTILSLGDTFVALGNGESPAGEEVDFVSDGTTDKFLIRNPTSFPGFEVTPSIHECTIISGFTVYTADDFPERDPASFIVEGRNSSTSLYETILSGYLNLPNDRNPPGIYINPSEHHHQEITFENAQAYTQYRVTFPTIKDDSEDNIFQVGEVMLTGMDCPTTNEDLSPTSTKEERSLLFDGSFDDNNYTHWKEYNGGYILDSSTDMSSNGGFSAKIINGGAYQTVHFDPPIPSEAKVTITGHSKAISTSTEMGNDYSICADIVLDDGSEMNNECAVFPGGDSNTTWDYSEHTFQVPKPITDMTIWALYQNPICIRKIKPTKDTYIRGGRDHGRQNYGDLLRAGIKSATFDSDNHRVMIMEFDLNSIQLQVGVPVKLHLYMDRINKDANRSLTISRVLDTVVWEEMDVTFDNWVFPENKIMGPSLEVAREQEKTWVEIDLTSLIHQSSIVTAKPDTLLLLIENLGESTNKNNVEVATRESKFSPILSTDVSFCGYAYFDEIKVTVEEGKPSCAVDGTFNGQEGSVPMCVGRQTIFVHNQCVNYALAKPGSNLGECESGGDATFDNPVFITAMEAVTTEADAQKACSGLEIQYYYDLCIRQILGKKELPI